MQGTPSPALPLITPADETRLDSQAQRPLPILRWAVLVVLLVSEFLGLSMAYDAHDRADDLGWPALVIVKSPKVLRVGMVAGLVTAAVAGYYLRREIRAAIDRESRVTAWLFVVAHLAGFALFAFATHRILAPSALGAPMNVSDILFWLASGVVTGLLWAAAVVPPAKWPMLAWRGRWALLIGIMIAGGGLLIAQFFLDGWDALARPTLWLSHRFLRFFTADTIYDPESHALGMEAFWVYVTAPCSGYEGMGLICAYLAGYFWLFRRELRFPQALLLLPLGLTVVWVVNAVRIAVLVWIGTYSPKLAIGGFHSQAGWLGFSAVALGLVWLSHRMRLFSVSPVVRSSPGTDPTAAYLAPLLAAVAVQMLTIAFDPSPDAWYPLRVGVAAALLTWFWRHYEGFGSGDWMGSVFDMAVGVGVFAMWVGLSQVMPGGDGIDARTIVADWPSWATGLWIAAWLVGFVIVTPLAEEIAFRGYLMRRLIATDFQSVPLGKFTWFSFLVSSAIFGLLHGQWLAGTFAGMAYAGVVYRTGRLRDAVVAHAVTNGLLAAVGFATGHWSG
ncbi:MAG TPA: exosortase E/protease, VPEID-CTERM system [Gemmataceae bacterium]|nr:exosortase E/protease, VPEID-CTERM system [Gemmataceae bacterium]